MDQFDFGNLAGLLGGFQQKMADMQARQKALRCEGTAGGGLVKVVVTGDFLVESVSIAQEASEDRELLEDLVRAATNEALRQARDSMKDGMQAMTGGLPIPPGLLGF
ncbi:MAG: YbaB/EbfC family nucleoid-associated protein [Myxococcales bacterium]|nr:YbaB/EbfC family nucleoid-associated protein [Myxococcales bacterium]MCB9672810.1 YbaB/EbfC family nucleoid-associated protein [Alphaproteobacteria bacterium]